MKESLSRALDKIQEEPFSVQIHKYSNYSLIGDCKKLVGWLLEHGIEYPSNTKIGDANLIVWRCRIGHNPWHHGWSMKEAINSAIFEIERQKYGTDS